MNERESEERNTGKQDTMVWTRNGDYVGSQQLQTMDKRKRGRWNTQ